MNTLKPLNNSQLQEIREIAMMTAHGCELEEAKEKEIKIDGCMCQNNYSDSHFEYRFISKNTTDTVFWSKQFKREVRLLHRQKDDEKDPYVVLGLPLTLSRVLHALNKKKHYENNIMFGYMSCGSSIWKTPVSGTFDLLSILCEFHSLSNGKDSTFEEQTPETQWAIYNILTQKHGT